MRSLFTRLPSPRDQRGAVLAVTAIVTPVILLVAGYVINVAIWYVHRQHLQTQADAAALAGANYFQYPCTPGGSMDTAIANTVYQYDGTTIPSGFNQQVWATPLRGLTNPAQSAYSNTEHDLFSVMNRPNFFNQSIPADTGLSGTAGADGSPCSDAAVDVKLSETNLPSVLPFGNPSYINSQARVSIEKLSASAGSEPFVEPLPSSLPSSIQATLVDESNANQPVAGPVTLSDTPGDLTSFTGQFANASFPTLNGGATGTSDAIGLRLCYQGGSCYETGSGPEGVTYTRVWADSTSTSAPPQVGDITVMPDTTAGATPCQTNDTNFVSTSSPCTVVVVANNVTFPTVSSPTCGNNGNVSLSLVVGTASPVTFPCPSGSLTNATWTSKPVIINENTGQTNFTLKWQATTGPIPSGASGGSGGKCGDGKGQDPPPCTGTLGAQRINSGAFSSSDTATSNSGSIIAVGLSDPNGNQLMSVQQGTTENVNVSVTVLGFQPSSTLGTDPIALSFSGNNANAAIGCNGTNVGSPQFFQSMVSGCTDVYQTQPAPGTCPPPAQYATPTSCAKENPGNGKLDKDLATAMNCKINGSGQASGFNCSGGNPTTCVNPNHWTAGPNGAQTIRQILDASPTDPRLIQLIITNNGALINGSAQVPILAFADFYVTGWSGGDPCIGQPTTAACSQANPQGCGLSANGVYYTSDDSPPGGASAPSGTLMGHFVQYTAPPKPGSQGSGVCTQGSLTNCVPILTK